MASLVDKWSIYPEMRVGTPRVCSTWRLGSKGICPKWAFQDVSTFTRLCQAQPSATANFPMAAEDSLPVEAPKNVCQRSVFVAL